jgi:hypothetical protein
LFFIELIDGSFLYIGIYQVKKGKEYSKNQGHKEVPFREVGFSYFEWLFRHPEVPLDRCEDMYFSLTHIFYNSFFLTAVTGVCESTLTLFIYATFSLNPICAIGEEAGIFEIVALVKG